MENPNEILIKNARIAFPQLFEPQTFNGEGEPAYSAGFLLPPDHPQIKQIHAKIEEVAQAKWPKAWQQILKTCKAKDSYTLHDGDLKSNLAGYAGMLYVNGRNAGRKGAPPMRPTVVNKDKTPLVAADGKPYSGCYVNVLLSLWAQDNDFGQKVNATIVVVQFAGDGEAFGPAVSSGESALEGFDVITDDSLV